VIDRRTLERSPDGVVASIRARRLGEGRLHAAMEALDRRGVALAEVEHARASRRSAATVDAARHARTRLQEARSELQRRDQELRERLLALPNLLHALDPARWDSRVRRCLLSQDAIAPPAEAPDEGRLRTVTALAAREALRHGYQLVEPAGLLSPWPRARNDDALPRILSTVPPDHLPGTLVGGVFADLRQERWAGRSIRRLALQPSKRPAESPGPRSTDLGVHLLAASAPDMVEDELSAATDVLLAALEALGIQVELLQLSPPQLRPEDGTCLALVAGPPQQCILLGEAALQGGYLARREGLRGEPHTVTATLHVPAAAALLSSRRVAVPTSCNVRSPSSATSLSIVTDVDDELWSALWERSPARTVFTSAGWSTVCGDGLSRWAARAGGEYVAGLVLPEIEGGIQQGTITAYLGPLGQTDEDTGALLPRSAAGLELLARVARERLPPLRLRCSPWLPDVRPFLWAGFDAALRYTAVVDIVDPALTWARFGAGLRARIRKAHREELLCAWSSDVDLLGRALRRTFTPWFDLDTALRQVEAALDAGLADLYEVRCARGAPQAAFLVTHAGTRAHYLLSGRVTGEAAESAVPFGMCASMLDMRRRLGVTEYDLEGSLLRGVAEFYDQFGGRLTPYVELRQARPAQ